jgi:hypothetical protein
MADVLLNIGLLKNLFPTLYVKRCACIYRKDQPINDVQYKDL